MPTKSTRQRLILPVCMLAVTSMVVTDCVAQGFSSDRHKSSSQIRSDVERARREVERKFEENNRRQPNGNWTGVPTPTATRPKPQKPKTPGFQAPPVPAAPKVIDVDFPYPDEIPSSSGESAKSENAGQNSPPTSQAPSSQPTAAPFETPTQRDELPGPADEVLYQDPEWHFRIEQLPGWEAMTATELDALNAFAGRLAPANRVRYQTGFRRLNTQPGTFPYVLIQSVPIRAKSYEEVERALEQQLPGAFKKVESKVREFANSAKLGQSVLDRSRNRVVLNMNVDVRGVGMAQGLSVGHIGREGMVFVHCYALQKDFSDWSDTFDHLNETFQFDEGYGFVENAAGKARIGDFMSAFNDPVSGSLTSIGVSLGSVMLAAALRKAYRAV